MNAPEIALPCMAYDPAAHECLKALSIKYGDWFMEHAHDVPDDGQPILNADGIESNLFDCYVDALVTARALSVYLAANPCRVFGSPQLAPEPDHAAEPELVLTEHPPLVDAQDHAVQVAARSHDHDAARHVRMRRAWPRRLRTG